MRIAISLLTLVFLLGANCSQTPPILSPQLDHISAAVLVNCDPYLKSAGETPFSQRTCMTLTNPLRELGRVFDVSQGEYLIAPNGNSPLALREVGVVSKLASYNTENESYVFALDINALQVKAIRARNRGTTQASFSTKGGLPSLVLGNRAIALFVTNPAGPQNPELFLVFQNGTLATAQFDPATSQFGALTPQAGAIPNTILDVAFDATSGLAAFLVQTATQNDIVVRSVSTDTPSNTSLTDVGRVKIAFGQMNTSTAAAPHLLIMGQDNVAQTSVLRTVRFNSVTLDIELNNPITLSHVVVAAYFPMGVNKNPCCGTAQDWLSVSADDGTFYYLTSQDLQNTVVGKVFSTQRSLGKLFNIAPANFSGLTQMIGGDIKILAGEEATKDRGICARQMFFVYSSGLVTSVCEGNENGATQIVFRNNVISS